MKFDGIIIINIKGEIILANDELINIYDTICDKKNATKDFIDLNIFDQEFECPFKNNFRSLENKSLVINPCDDLSLAINCNLIKIDNRDDSIVGVIQVHDISTLARLTEFREKVLTAFSHELRTPLTVLNLGLKNLKNHRTKLNEEQFNKIIESMILNTNYITEFTKYLLNNEILKSKNKFKEKVKDNFIQIISNLSNVVNEDNNDTTRQE